MMHPEFAKDADEMQVEINSDKEDEMLASLGIEKGREGQDEIEEHTSELQSHSDLVFRLLLEKKKKH